MCRVHCAWVEMVEQSTVGGRDVRLIWFKWRSMLLAASLLSGVSSVAAAPAVMADVPLDFGVLAVKSNVTPSTLRVSSLGSVSFTGNVIPIGGAIRGQYRLTGFPPGVLLELQWDDATLSAGGGGLPEFLTVTNYENPTLVANAAGEALVAVGATLRTSASGVMYTDAPYSGTTQIRVRYWSQAMGGYLTYYGSVTFSARTRSAINITETQSLSFGRVAAYATPGAIAAMTLGVDGSINVVNAGSARITALGAAQIGLIHVTGAAPSYAVTITPESGNRFLTHVTEGLNAARFVAKNFVTSPSSPGARTDAAGELQIKVGATLETELTNKAYINGIYSGTYALTVSY